jgi:hypothetical protein
LSKAWNGEPGKKSEKSDDDQPNSGRATALAVPYRYRDHGGDYRQRVKNLSTKFERPAAEGTPANPEVEISRRCDAAKNERLFFRQAALAC